MFLLGSFHLYLQPKKKSHSSKTKQEEKEKDEDDEAIGANLKGMVPTSILTEYQLISVNITQYPVKNNFEIILSALNWA